LPLQISRAIAMQDLTKKFSLSSKIKVCDDMPSAIHHAFNTKQVVRQTTNIKIQDIGIKITTRHLSCTKIIWQSL
jgi:hypothetical protein